VQLSLIHAHTGGLCRCYSDDRISGSLRPCLLKYYLLGLLNYYLLVLGGYQAKRSVV
jgi:hypothetical protein